MPGSANQFGRIYHLPLVLCLLVAAPLDALDGDAEDVQLVVAPTTGAASEKHLLLADVPGDPASLVLAQPLPHPPTLTLLTRRPPITYPVRCRPSLRAGAGAGDADADPA